LETIERSQRGAKAKRFQLVDALHLEVAVVEGKELFSWPGEREFKDRDLREFAPTGAIANGSFAIHARSVFLSGAPLITYRGEETINGRAVARYDYTVPQNRSGYQIRIGPLIGITGYRGSFWNDVETLDVKRLDVEAIEIPTHLPLHASREILRYERVPIGESTFLLPKSSEMVLEDVQGGQNRNAIGFSKCRQYSGESTLSFAEVPENDAAPTPLAEAIVLPAGLSVELELVTAIQFPGNAIGDEVEARVRHDVKRKGAVMVPKGALVKGNVAVLARQLDFRGNVGLMVALQWREISFDGKVGPFEGQLEEGGAIPITGSSTRSIYQRPMPRNREVLPHRDVFYVRKDNSQLPRGLLLNWRTRDPGNVGAKKP
ncbi:MAG: hypothetical protein ABIO24_09165, partial [Saprospiraceae bacterium]